MVIFSTAGGIKVNQFDRDNGNPNTKLEGFGLISAVSFGNMGFASTNCGKNFIYWNETESTELGFRCQGSTQITQVMSVGIIQYQDESNLAGLNQTFHSCYADPEGDTGTNAYDLIQYFPTETFSE
jgi:hypothetical protein